MTLSVLISPPSFSQESTVVIDPILVIGQPLPIQAIWGPSQFDSPNPYSQGCTSIGCESEDPDDGYNYEPTTPILQTCSDGPEGLLYANGAYTVARSWALAQGGPIALAGFYAQHPTGSQYLVVFPDWTIGFYTVSCNSCGSAMLLPGLGCNP